MSKRKSVEAEEQQELFEVEPQNAKVIARHARAYKRSQSARSEALAEEVKHRRKLLEAVKEAGVVANQDGSLRFRANGAIISVQPRDELVRVKFEGDED